MIARFSLDKRGRIPFAFVALTILVLTVAAGAYMVEQSAWKSKENTRDGSVHTADYQALSALDLETRAYYIAHEVLRERMNVTAENDTKDLDVVDEMVRRRLEAYINETYPVTEGVFTVTVPDWDVNLLIDEMNTMDLLGVANTTRSGRTYVMDNTSLLELDTVAPPLLRSTARSLYFRLVGYAKYRIFNSDENISVEKYDPFDKNVYSPLPLMKNLAGGFKAESTGEFGPMGRMIRYMITTIAQYRVLSGYAGGGYGGPHDGKGLSDVVTGEDVETAVNLALLLTQARHFRDHDEDAAEAQETPDPAANSVGNLMDNYVNNGSVDPADLIALYNDLENYTIDAGRIFAQSIYGFSDRFVWELLELFWGEEWDPDGDGHREDDTYFDPTLDEPIVDWEEIEAKTDTEQWSRDRLWHYLGVVGKWLGITDTGDENGDIVRIEAQPEESAVIKDVYSRYRHPALAGEVVGAPSGADLCDVPVPPPGYGPPDYYVAGTDAYHVDGRYYLFGSAADSTFSDNRWYVRAYIRPEEADQGESTDARYLILGEVPGQGGDDGRPYTYKLVTRDNWGSGVGERTYEYYAVKESLIEKHGDHADGGPYYNTFRFIVEALTRSMKQQPSDIDNIRSKGMLDYAAYDTERQLGERNAELTIDPKDDSLILEDHLRRMTEDENGAIRDPLAEFSGYADQEKENWFRQGAYLNDTADPDDTEEYFLYDLMKETVDLWYEAAVNLYDGGNRDFDEDGSSLYGPEDGPEHWNNYDGAPNSELPVTRFQTSKHETEATDEKLAGTFKFRNDALRDSYYRVMQIVEGRDDAVEFSFQNWEDLGSQHWVWTVKGSCGEAGVLYGWVFVSAGDTAVPVSDQQMIPRESYDGTGSPEDLTPNDDPWRTPGAAYAEGIWDILKTGNSERTNLANNDPGGGIREAAGNVVGWSGWPVTTNEGLLDDVTEGHVGSSDTVTDEGTYGYPGGSYDFTGDFYGLVKEYVGSEFLDRGALWDRLAEEDGWLWRIIREETADRIGDGLDLFNIPTLTSARSHVPRTFWHGSRERAAENGTLFTEEFVVDQVPDALREEDDTLSVDIKVPANGSHFVDAQDIEFPMSNDCFNAIWWVNVSGEARYRVRNSKRSSVDPKSGGHDHFWYNFTVDFDIDLPVSIFSGWDLETGWRTEDIDYRMTRRYFGKTEADTPSDPFFISKPLTETIDATRDAADWMLDTKTAEQTFLRGSPLFSGRERIRFVSNMTGAVIRATDPRDDVEGLLEEASDSDEYLNNISANAGDIEGEGISELYFTYFGYDALYDAAGMTLRVERGDLEEGNGSAFRYEMRFDADMNFTGEDRITDFLSYSTSLSARSPYFEYSGKISPYDELDEGKGTIHDFTIDTGGAAPGAESRDRAVDRLPLPLFGRNASVRTGLTATVTLPDGLKRAIDDTTRFELEKHRGASLTGQTELYVKYFLGKLYNDHLNELAAGDMAGIVFNATSSPGPAVPHRYLNVSYGIDLRGLSGEEAAEVLGTFVKHLINNTDHMLAALIEPNIPPSFFSKIPEGTGDRVVHTLRAHEEDGDIIWKGSASLTATSAPYLGSPWSPENPWLEAGKLRDDDTGYLLRYTLEL